MKIKRGSVVRVIAPNMPVTGLVGYVRAIFPATSLHRRRAEIVVGAWSGIIALDLLELA